MLCSTSAFDVTTGVGGIAHVAKQIELNDLFYPKYIRYVNITWPIIFLVPYNVCSTATKLI